MASSVSGPDDSDQSSKSDVPMQVQTGMSKAYTASNAPAIKQWFETMFPGMSEADLDNAVSEWMQNEMKYMQSFMSKLQEQQQEAYEEMKKSIEGED